MKPSGPGALSGCRILITSQVSCSEMGSSSGWRSAFLAWKAGRFKVSVLDSALPMRSLKNCHTISSLSSYVVATMSPSCNLAMKFFGFWYLAWGWKNLVLASPSDSQSILERVRRIVRCRDSKASRRCLSWCGNHNSSLVRVPNSWAMSSRRSSSLACSICAAMFPTDF